MPLAWVPGEAVVVTVAPVESQRECLPSPAPFSPRHYLPMSSLRRARLLIWGSVALLLTQWGCAVKLSPSEPARAELATVGVVSARFSPEANFYKPATTRSAGAGRGAAIGANAVRGDIIGLFLLPPALLVGAIAGAAVTPVPATAVEEAETTLRNALAELNIQGMMRDRLMQTVERRAKGRFVVVTARPGRT